MPVKSNNWPVEPDSIGIQWYPRVKTVRCPDCGHDFVSLVLISTRHHMPLVGEEQLCFRCSGEPPEQASEV